MMAADVPAAARKRLVACAARLRVAQRELDRAIYRAVADAGLAPEVITDLVDGHSQTSLQQILRRFGTDPTLLRRTPDEVIDLRAAGFVDDHEMMDELLNWPLTFGGVAHVGGVAVDAYASGDWDAIETAFYRGLLDDREFHRLAEHHLKGASGHR